MFSYDKNITIKNQKAMQKLIDKIHNENQKESERLLKVFEQAKKLEMVDENSYKFKTTFVGCSDIASLIAVGIGTDGNLNTKCIDFDEDASYKCYLLCEKQNIPKHYKKVYEFKNWLKIYDDDGKTITLTADSLEVYRAGAMGLLIKLI